MPRSRRGRPGPLDTEFEELVRRRLRAIADAQRVQPWQPTSASRQPVQRHRALVRGRVLAVSLLVVALVVGVSLFRSTPRVVTTSGVPDSGTAASVTNDANSPNRSEPTIDSTASDSTLGLVPRPTPPAQGESTSVSALPPGFIGYVVQDGDLLASIARNHGTTPEAIAAANHWSDGPNHILRSGATILIPID